MLSGCAVGGPGRHAAGDLGAVEVLSWLLSKAHPNFEMPEAQRSSLNLPGAPWMSISALDGNLVGPSCNFICFTPGGSVCL